MPAPSHVRDEASLIVLQLVHQLLISGLLMRGGPEHHLGQDRR
jgi:hypothetical protein